MNSEHENKLAQQISESENVPLAVVRKVLREFRRLTEEESVLLNVSELENPLVLRKPIFELFKPGAQQLVGLPKTISWKIAPDKITGTPVRGTLRPSAGGQVCMVKTVSPKGVDVVMLPTKKLFTIPFSDIGNYALLTDLEGNPTTPPPEED